MTPKSGSYDSDGVVRLQVLWHLLTGIPLHMRGLASLPNVRHWVLERLGRAGITTLTDLIAADPFRVNARINVGLFLLLQEQAQSQLCFDLDEVSYVNTFTDGFPLVSNFSALLSMPIEPR